MLISKFGYGNIYKEVRSISLNAVVAKLTSQIVGRHETQRESLAIVTITELKGYIEHNTKKKQIRKISKHDIKFPLLYKRIRPSPVFRTVLDLQSVLLA